MNFFKKADNTSNVNTILQDDDASLFFEDQPSSKDQVSPIQTPTPPQDGAEESREVGSIRYNEDPRAVKRRRTNDHSVPRASIDGGDVGEPNRAITEKSGLASGAASCDGLNCGGLVELPTEAVSQSDDVLEAPSDRLAENIVPSNGPFMEDPDSEDEMIKHLTATAFTNAGSSEDRGIMDESSLRQVKSGIAGPSIVDIPSLRREGTSIIGGDGFDGVEDFIDDEFPEDGEEYMERLWMDEQQRLELDLEDEPIGDDSRQDTEELDGHLLHNPIAAADDGTESCPICSASFRGIRPEVGHVVSMNFLFVILMMNYRMLRYMLTTALMGSQLLFPSRQLHQRTRSSRRNWAHQPTSGFTEQQLPSQDRTIRSRWDLGTLLDHRPSRSSCLHMPKTRPGQMPHQPKWQQGVDLPTSVFVHFTRYYLDSSYAWTLSVMEPLRVARLTFSVIFIATITLA